MTDRSADVTTSSAASAPAPGMRSRRPGILAAAMLALVFGLLAAGLLAPRPPPPLLAAGAALLLLLALGSVRAGPARPARKLVTRLLPMALAAALPAAGLRAADGAGLAAALFAAATLAAALGAYRRRGPDRAPCAACPERPAGPACSGFREVVRRERSFARLAGRWISRASAGPGTRAA